MEHENMSEEVQQVMAADMSGLGNQGPRKTWFFERVGDGMIFECEEKEAWEVVYNQSQWRRHDFKLLGVSDGTTYHRIIKESMAEASRLKPLIEDKKAELAKYRRSEENLIANEAVDMEDTEDPVNAENIKKVLRLRKIMDRLNNELDNLEEQYKNSVGDLVKKAKAAELEVARGHIEWPENANIATPGVSQAERQRILRVMGKA